MVELKFWFISKQQLISSQKVLQTNICEQLLTKPKENKLKTFKTFLIIYLLFILNIFNCTRINLEHFGNKVNQN